MYSIKKICSSKIYAVTGKTMKNLNCPLPHKNIKIPSCHCTYGSEVMTMQNWRLTCTLLKQVKPFTTVTIVVHHVYIFSENSFKLSTKKIYFVFQYQIYTLQPEVSSSLVLVDDRDDILNHLFKPSALWADGFHKSKYLSVCPSVCLFVRLFTFQVPFKRLFAPISKSWMSKTFRDSESLVKSNGKKWFQV